MGRNLLLGAIAIGLVLPIASADAAKRKRRSYEYGHQYGLRVYQAPQAPVALRHRGPPWAMPNECFTDEGYGRWAPCGGRDR
jgi:hypothetical protein